MPPKQTPSKRDNEATQQPSLEERYAALRRRFPRRLVYAAVSINDPSAIVRIVTAADVLERITGDLGMVLQSRFHVTTRFFGGDGSRPDPEWFVRLAPLNGSSIHVRLERILFDSKGACIVVSNSGNAGRGDNDAAAECGEDFPCANRYPHLTLANLPGVPPKYSNELIERYHTGSETQRAAITAVDLPPNTTVRGTFEFC